ncbi:hypothetical protein D3C80_1861810 [compost metagenome]
MRISLEPFARTLNAHQFEQLHNSLTRRRPGQPLVQREAFAQLPLNRVQRVQ